jgi:hypothetical protein
VTRYHQRRRWEAYNGRVNTNEECWKRWRLLRSRPWRRLILGYSILVSLRDLPHAFLGLGIVPILSSIGGGEFPPWLICDCSLQNVSPGAKPVLMSRRTHFLRSHQLHGLRPLCSFGVSIVVIHSSFCTARLLPARRRWWQTVHYAGDYVHCRYALTRVQDSELLLSSGLRNFDGLWINATKLQI